MSARILCVDDEPAVLSAFERGLRGRFEVDTAASGADGLQLVATRPPYAVIVSDMRMPGMDGIQFLAEVKERAPDSVRIMLTGNSDLDTAIQAVNEGNIFRFLCKPCPTDVLVRALEAGVQQHRLITAEKELLTKTLCGSVKMLSDVLALANPTAFGRAARVRRIVQRLAAELKIAQAWELELAATLSQIGLLALPPETLEKLYHGHALVGEEVRMFASHPGIGRDLVANIPRLERIAEIIAYQEKCFDGSGFPTDDRKGADIPLGARILKAALDFDGLCMSGLTPAEALGRMSQRAARYDPSVLAALQAAYRVEVPCEVRRVRVADLTGAMIIAEDVRSATGLLLVSRGQEATPSLRERLKNLARLVGVQEPIRVMIPVRPAAGGVASPARPEPVVRATPAREPAR